MPITTRLATHDDIAALNDLITQSVRGLSKDYHTSDQIESALKYVFDMVNQLIIDII